LNQALKWEEDNGWDLSYSPGLAYIRNTTYSPAVEAYMNTFKNVKVLLYDDLKNDAQKVVDEITDFLDLDRVNLLTEQNKIYNASSPPIKEPGISSVAPDFLKRLIPSNFKKRMKTKLQKEEKLEENTKVKLAKLFKPEVQQLSVLIDKDLLNWKEKYDKILHKNFT